MKGYIYITTCLVNGKKYVGQSTNHKNKGNYIGSGIAFKCAIRKYGTDNFVKEIIHDNILSLDELNKLERKYISEFNTLVPNGYNIDLGGTNKGRCSNTTKLKISNNKKGKPHNETQKNANRNSHIGIKLSDETKNKISLAMRGKSSWNKDKKMPKGHSDKMRKIMTGKIMNKKKIEILDTIINEIIICDGVVDAASKLNISNGMISLLNNGKIKHIKNRYYLVGVMTPEALYS